MYPNVYKCIMQYLLSGLRIYSAHNAQVLFSALTVNWNANIHHYNELLVSNSNAN